MGVGESQAYCAGVVSDTLAVMTYRQWLVGMAMQGLLASGGEYECLEHIAKDAVCYADAVLSELEKQT